MYNYYTANCDPILENQPYHGINDFEIWPCKTPQVYLGKYDFSCTRACGPKIVLVPPLSIFICDVAGENRPTGAYFIIEFDLTKVVI